MILGYKFYGRESLPIQRLSLRYSRPSSLYKLSLDMTLTAPAVARLGSY